MACGCGGAGNTEKFKVQAKDGTTKTFSTRAEAETFAIRQGGGMVTRA